MTRGIYFPAAPITSKLQYTMRLSDSQIKIIKNTVTSTLGEDCNIWLFGSRVDDSRRGGDIDLYIEPLNSKLLLAIMKCKVSLEENLDLHVDLVVRESGKDKPIYHLAKVSGIQL